MKNLDGEEDLCIVLFNTLKKRRDVLKRMLFVLAIIAGLPMSLYAQSTEHVEAAKELLYAMEAERAVQDGAIAAMEVEFKKDPQLAENRDLIEDFMREVLDWGELEGPLAQMYAELFTTEELRGLTEFYRSPLGQRLIEEEIALNLRIAEITSSRVNRAMPQLIEKLMERSQAAGGL